MVELTILNSMAGSDFEAALDQHVAWNIRVLDLKNAIFGKDVAELNSDEAHRAARAIQARDLQVYNLSTMFFFTDVAKGEDWFRSRYLDKLDQLLMVASILCPQMIRLLGAEIAQRSSVDNSIAYLNDQHPWLIPQYQEAVDRIVQAGFQVTIENETGNCIFANPNEVHQFFEQLNRPAGVCFTWDVQNMWELGTFPSVEVYEQLKPWLGFYHVKGGQQRAGDDQLYWKSALEDASWPVTAITQKVVDDQVSPVICLNPSHGKAKAGYDPIDTTKRDLEFLRTTIKGVR